MKFAKCYETKDGEPLMNLTLSRRDFSALWSCWNQKESIKEKERRNERKKEKEKERKNGILTP